MKQSHGSPCLYYFLVSVFSVWHQ